MRKLVFSFLLASSVLVWADDANISSPDGKLQVTVTTNGGRVYYSAMLDGKEMLVPSALGLKTSIGDFTRDLTLMESQSEDVNYTYTMRGTKSSGAEYKANRMTMKFHNKDNMQMSIVFQVSNNNIAFRYELPRQDGNRQSRVMKKCTPQMLRWQQPQDMDTDISSRHCSIPLPAGC